MPKLIILDRDGVINYDSDKYIKSPDEWHPIPGSLDAIARFNQADYRIVVITNQSGLSRGLFTLDDLNQIHQKMYKQLAKAGGNIEAIFFCPHSEKENCKCRKPHAGLFHSLTSRLNISLTNVPAVGDSWRDLKAASVAAAKPILVLTGNGRRTLNNIGEFKDVSVYNDLAAYADYLLE